MPSKISHDEFAGRVARLFGGKILVRGTYSGRHSLVAVECADCGHEWTPYAGNLLAGRANCKRCSDGRKTPPWADVLVSIKAGCGERIRVIGSFVSVRQPLAVACTTCGHEWQARITDLRQGHACPRCAGKLLDHPEVVRRIAERHGGRLRVLGRFASTGKRLTLGCVPCGRVWAPTANQVLMGCGCATCNRQGFDPAKPSLLYAFRFTGPAGQPLYKVGITNRTPQRRYEGAELQRMTLLRTVRFATGAEARDAERRILITQAACRYHGPTGFSFSDVEVFVRDVTGQP